MARRENIIDLPDAPAPGPRPKGTQPSQNSGGSTQNATDQIFQSSERGKPLPLAYGTVRVGPNIIERYDSVGVTNTLPNWTRDTDYTLSDARRSYGNNYQCIVPGHSALTGALGAGPSGTGTDIVDGDAGAGTAVHWKYIAPGIYTAMVLGFCEGQAFGVGKAWQDSFRYTDYTQLAAISANFALFLGTPAGVVKPGWFPAGSDPLPDYYSNTVILFISGTSGADATVPNVSLEIHALFADAMHVDVSPADIAIDMLTHPRRGVFWPAARVDAVSSGSVDPSSWRNYCTAYGLNLSWVIDTQTDVLTLIGLLLDATNSDAIQTNRPDGLGFMLKFVPRGDQPLTANGVTFTPITTATPIGPDDLLEPITIQRSPPIDRFNSCPIEYVNRDGDYVRDAVDDPDMADVELRGLRRATTFALPQVIAPESAVMLSRIRAQRSLNVVRTFTLKLPDRFLLLEPTDLLTVSDPVMGLVNVPMRVTAVGEDIGAGGGVTITAEDWPGLVHAAAAYTPQPNDGYKPNQATPISRSPVLPDQVPLGTLTDSGTTRGGAVLNAWPNYNSEANPPDGADPTTAEWAGRVQVVGAYSGNHVRELAATMGTRQLLGDATKFVEGVALYPAPGFARSPDQSQLGFIVPCSPGESFYMEAQVRFVAGVNGEYAGVFMYFLDSDGVGVAQPTVINNLVLCGVSTPTAWAKSSAQAMAPVGSVSAYFFCRAGSDLGDVAVQFDALVVRQKIAGPFVITPGGGWTVASVKEPAYWRDMGDVVRMKGRAQWHTGATILFTFPPEYRPSNTGLKYFDVYNVTTGARHSVSVDYSGDIRLTAFSALPADGDILSFDMVAFLAEQ